MNIRIILQYEGTRYDGWQRQGNTDNTVQGRLEAVLSRMAGGPVEVAGSGRTDKGVHAAGQVANFHLPDRESGWDPAEVRACLNKYLPEDIRVLSACEAAPRFHSRLNAKGKTYCYRVETGEKRDVFSRRQVCALGQPLDLAAMRRAAGYLEGTHDFRGFSSLKRFKKSTVRIMESVEIQTDGTETAFFYTGDGFLYNMVRIVTGTLVEVGLGLRSPESVEEILRTGDRALAGRTMPPEGLTLMSVSY